MFIDSAIIFCAAGQGGNGCNSTEMSKSVYRRRPTGGDGGKGGSIILTAKTHVHTLLDLQMRKTFKGNDGKHGGGNNMAGADAEDQRIYVPVGTQVFDDSTGHELKDLIHEGDEVEVCRGGLGGKGNHKHAQAMPGELGESKTIRLELKLIADVGLVGFPNAGKSTLISHVSNARSKIAAYPFTTKDPILGVVKLDDESLVVADIPGLIEGAHEGRGMGQRFLRHIERTKLFLHIIDMAGTDGRDPVEDYRVINAELAGYSEEFLSKPRIIAANKMDIPQAHENLVKFRKKVKGRVFEISAATGQGLSELMAHLLTESKREPEAT